MILKEGSSIEKLKNLKLLLYLYMEAKISLYLFIC